jgi:tetratricopeptide (TPR) repeat protein
VTEYRAKLALRTRKLDEAERLAWLRVKRGRERASVDAGPADAHLNDNPLLLRELAVALADLAELRWDQRDRACLLLFEEALDVVKRVGDRAEEAFLALRIAHTHSHLPSPDLQAAERWCKRSLELRDANDWLGRGRSLLERGFIALERFRAAQLAGNPEDVQLRFLQEAMEYYRRSQRLIRVTGAFDDLAVAHNQLGVIYGYTGNSRRALSHFETALALELEHGNIYGAAEGRYNMARVYAENHAFSDALQWAEAALRDFEALGDGGAERAHLTRDLIHELRMLELNRRSIDT